MLVLSDDQNLARALERSVRAEQGSRRGEREGAVGRDRAGQRRALGQLDERVVVDVVELDVANEQLWRDVLEDLVQLLDRRDERVELLEGLEALCREQGCRALERTAQFDRVGYVGAGERAHNEATAGERLQQPFVSERREREAERRPRDAESLRELDLGDALPRSERAVENELAQAQLGLHRL